MSTATEVKHTPGPWRVEPETEDQALSIVAGENAGQDSETIIAEIEGTLGDCEEANARLIAAAPDMLAALKGVNALFSDEPLFDIKKLGSPITNGDQERIDRVFIAIDAAISKAERGQ